MSGAARRYVHVFATFGAGGPQIRALQLFAHLGKGVRHVVMAMDGRTEAKAQLPPGIDVEFAAAPPRGGFRATVRAQRAWLAAQGADLVLTYNWGAIETVAAARGLGLPLVHHEDGFGPEEAVRRLWRRRLIRRWFLRGVPLIVPSQVLARIAAMEWGARPDTLHLLPNGVDLTRFAPAAAAPSADRAAVIGTVGGLRPEKDHATLLRAFAALPTGPRLRIVGGGALHDELTRLAAALGVAARTDFVGPVADTAPQYRAHDVFVLSSRTEQMPIAMLEAMASGLPVVATDVGDVRAILPEVQQPFVVEKGDPQALATAIGGVLGDAALRARLGAANRAQVEVRYEMRRCLDRFAAVYAAASGEAAAGERLATSRSPG